MTAGGAWRRPRMKVYDYNQEFGGNYYQVPVVDSFLVRVYVISWELSDDANIFSAVFFIHNGKKFIPETSNIL